MRFETHDGQPTAPDADHVETFNVVARDVLSQAVLSLLGSRHEAFSVAGPPEFRVGTAPSCTSVAFPLALYTPQYLVTVADLLRHSMCRHVRDAPKSVGLETHVEHRGGRRKIVVADKVVDGPVVLVRPMPTIRKGLKGDRGDPRAIHRQGCR